MRIFFWVIILVWVAGAGAARLDLITSVPMVKARQIAFQGDQAWVAQNFDGATLLDIHDARRPVVRKHFTSADMQPLFFKTLPAENLLLSADRFQGLVIYDVAKPDNPTTVSVLPLAGMTTHLDVTETTDARRLAVLARAGEGLLCVDITDPAAPRITDRFTSGVEFTRAVAVADGIVYAADSREGGLKALRLISPGRFEPLYQANLFGSCESLTVHDDKIYAGYLNYGFRIYELPDAGRLEETTPTLRVLSTSLRNRSRLRAIATSGTLAVAANDEIGVDLYETKSPSLPWLCDEFRFHEGGILAHSCSIYRDTVFVPAWEAGLLIFAITNEPSPADFNLENVNYVTRREQ